MPTKTLLQLKYFYEPETTVCFVRLVPGLMHHRNRTGHFDFIGRRCGNIRRAGTGVLRTRTANQKRRHAVAEHFVPGRFHSAVGQCQGVAKLPYRMCRCADYSEIRIPGYQKRPVGGDVQIKQATMSGGEALIRAFSLGANSSYGIVASCLKFMNESNLDQYALKFGKGMSQFSAGIGILQTIIVCADGDITNGDILTAISAALGTDAIFISAPVTAGIVGVTGCIIGLISCFVTENMPNELYIDLGNGVKATIYILDNFMYV